jgi:hypothetical protein
MLLDFCIKGCLEIVREVIKTELFMDFVHKPRAWYGGNNPSQYLVRETRMNVSFYPRDAVWLL